MWLNVPDYYFHTGSARSLSRGEHGVRLTHASRITKKYS
jgi:hypothetical protein